MNLPVCIYNTATGVVRLIGYLPDAQPGLNEAKDILISDRMPEERADFFLRTAPGMIARRPQQEIADLLLNERRFNRGRFLAKFNQQPDVTAKVTLLAQAVAELAQQIQESNIP